jgi:hypothetical protein
MESFFVNFDYLYQHFPNIDEIMFSSNGVAYTEKILEAMHIVDDIINKPCHFEVQFSVDG